MKTNRMWKKVTAWILCLAMTGMLAACGQKNAAGTTETVKVTEGTTKTAESAAQTENGTEGTEGTQAAGASGQTFKIGAFLQLSGGNAMYGMEARDAILLAIDYVNENGGFNGVPVELVTYDTQGSAEEAVKIATKLIEIEKVDAVIGSVNSGEVFAAAGYLNDAGIYTMGLGTSPSWMAEDWPYVFRACMNNNYAVPMTLDMMEDLNLENVAVFYGQDDACLATAESFEQQAKERNIAIVDSQSYDPGDTDYSAQIASILAADPQCIYIALSGEAIPVAVKQIRMYGFTGIIFAKESFMTSHIEIAGAENSDYIAFANPYVTYESVDAVNIPIVKDFCQRYEEAYGSINGTECAYRGWDSVMVMWEASKIAGSNDSEALRDATNTISGLEALGGTMDFTSGDREGLQTFNKFMLHNKENILWTDWLEQGGYDEYKNATGNEH